MFLRKSSLLIIIIIIAVVSSRPLLAERGVTVTSSGEAVVKGDYLIRYGFFDKNQQGGLTHLYDHDAEGKIDLKKQWNDSIDTFLEYQHAPFSPYHSQRASISTLNSFVGAGEFDLYWEGLEFGLYRVPRSQGEVWSDGANSVRKSFLHFQVEQAIHLAYDISWPNLPLPNLPPNERPDFLMIAAFGDREDKVDAQWTLEDGSEEPTSFPVWTGFRGGLAVKDSWQRSLFHTYTQRRGRRDSSPEPPLPDSDRGAQKNSFETSFRDLKQHLGKDYRHSFLSTFKRQSLSVKIDVQHNVSHSDTWHLSGGRVGILVRPIYVDSFKPLSENFSEEEKNRTVEKFRATDDPYELIVFFGRLLSTVRTGSLAAPFTMEIRDEIFKRLKKSDDLSLKEILSQLARILVQYQRSHFLPEIEKRISRIEKEDADKKRFLETISKLEKLYIEKGDREMEEVSHLVRRELKQYLDQASLSQERIQNLVDALSAFLERKRGITFKEIAQEIEAMKREYPILEEMEEAIRQADTELLWEKLSEVRDALSAEVEKSRKDVEAIRRLYSDLSADLEGRNDKGNIPSKEIGERFEVLRIVTVTDIEKNLKTAEALNVSRDLILTDEKIFESEEPWEKLD